MEINKILEINNFDDYTSLEILKNQDLVASYLSKSVIQNNSINRNFVLKKLSWLKNSSKNLADRLKLNIYSHNENFIKKEKIIRSSYKFCSFKHNCNYNYNYSGKKGCYADHYVHHMVHADIDSLIKCINKYYNGEIFNSNKEIIKCINTVSFVIKHMYEELNNLCIQLYHSKMYLY